MFSAMLADSGEFLFDFSVDSDLSNWMIVDDVVMGGRSDGNFSLNDEGHAVFSGRVSLENNGGFSSVRHTLPVRSVASKQAFVFRVKGDGKRYQFRVKTNANDRHSYIHYFETTGEWQTVRISMAEMYPSFRGRRLRIPNYPGEQVAEITFLIANKQAESFALQIDWIGLE